jgi:hypothetical protein
MLLALLLILLLFPLLSCAIFQAVPAGTTQLSATQAAKLSMAGQICCRDPPRPATQQADVPLVSSSMQIGTLREPPCTHHAYWYPRHPQHDSRDAAASR